jgi:hypothetical protein
LLHLLEFDDVAARDCYFPMDSSPGKALPRLTEMVSFSAEWHSMPPLPMAQMSNGMISHRWAGFNRCLMRLCYNGRYRNEEEFHAHL